ncbi:MAG TPA: DUF1080 domain-containing protein [Luteolibacter sp.]|nr:DUF1080 domain-containing protein [Luteolibacter sp.]
MKSILPLFAVCLLAGSSVAFAQTGSLDPAQEKYVAKYKGQPNPPKPEAMLLNSDKEPALTEGFTSLFNGKDLTGWTPKGGTCTFEAKDGTIVGTCVKGSPNTYLSTTKDYGDFIFTCEMKWLVDGNSGIMFRAIEKAGKGKPVVMGPQAEMEGFRDDRGWSGGIYGQDCGGWWYPLWLKEHAEVRKALKKDDWNRITIQAKGNTVKTWVNGLPAAHWVNDQYLKGFLSLQIHSGAEGQVVWRDVKIKEL